MIYVCRVDTGTRHIFDLANGIDNVGALASQIEAQFRIEKPKQILLISGGEVLDDYQCKFYGRGFGCVSSLLVLFELVTLKSSSYLYIPIHIHIHTHTQIHTLKKNRQNISIIQQMIESTTKKTFNFHRSFDMMVLRAFLIVAFYIIRIVLDVFTYKKLTFLFSSSKFK